VDSPQCSTTIRSRELGTGKNTNTSILHDGGASCYSAAVYYPTRPSRGGSASAPQQKSINQIVKELFNQVVQDTGNQWIIL